MESSAVLRRMYDAWNRGETGALEAWESFRIEPLEVIEEGDAVIARLQFRARGKTSGVGVDLEFAHGFRLDGERVAYLVARDSIEGVRARIAELRESAAWPARVDTP
jgi:hypothetical protein